MDIRHFFLIALISSQCALHAKVSTEADISAFFPTSSNLQEIYGNVWTDVGISIDHVPFIPGYINLFAMANYLFASGSSESGGESTHINLVPITLGLKWTKKVHNKIECYLGAAPRYYFMYIKNNSPYVPEKFDDNGWGAFATSGAFFYPVKNLMINIFLNYSYKNFAAPNNSAGIQTFSTNVSGFDLGGGLGWNF